MPTIAQQTWKETLEAYIHALPNRLDVRIFSWLWRQITQWYSAAEDDTIMIETSDVPWLNVEDFLIFLVFHHQGSQNLK